MKGSKLIMHGRYWHALELGLMGRALRRTINETDLASFFLTMGSWSRSSSMPTIPMPPFLVA
jgi:hypothetical protein